jgi:hypothetical protein
VTIQLWTRAPNGTFVPLTVTSLTRRKVSFLSPAQVEHEIYLSTLGKGSRRLAGFTVFTAWGRELLAPTGGAT